MNASPVSRGWGVALASASALLIGSLLTHMAGHALGQTAPLDPVPRGFTSTQGCLSCHRIEPTFSHPVGVQPGRPIPSSLPLVDGRIECVTCHQISTPSDHASAGRISPFMLRGSETGAAFCAQCHVPSARVSREMHVSIGRAHLYWPAKGSADSTKIALLDSESTACLSCHDGSVARAVSTDRSALAAGHASNHPVGTRYPNSPGSLAPLASQEWYWPAAGLDQRVRLFGQAVGCGSCHSPYSRHAGLLVMPNVSSKLCLGCHRT